MLNLIDLIQAMPYLNNQSVLDELGIYLRDTMVLGDTTHISYSTLIAF